MARPPERARERLALAHLRQQQRIAEILGAQMARLVAQLPDVSDDTQTAYVARAAPAVAAGQRRAGTLAAAYLRALTDSENRVRPVNLPFEELLVTTATPWVGSPILRARAKLAEGLPLPAALDAAGAYAAELSSGDLQAAQRFGLDRAADALDAGVIGYRKVLSAGACAWCRKVAGEGASSPRRYHRADALPFHQHDRCSVAPIFADD